MCLPLEVVVYISIRLSHSNTHPDLKHIRLHQLEIELGTAVSRRASSNNSTTKVVNFVHGLVYFFCHSCTYLYRTMLRSERDGYIFGASKVLNSSSAPQLDFDFFLWLTDLVVILQVTELPVLDTPASEALRHLVHKARMLRRSAMRVSYYFVILHLPYSLVAILRPIVKAQCQV